MALPLVRLPSLPARQPPPLRLPKHSSLAPHGGRVSFAAACSSGGRAAFGACCASASVAPAPAAEEAVEEPEEGPRTRVVASNIPWDCTADDMRELFGKYGSVVDVELWMYNSSRNRGLAFVTMGSEEEALSALNNLNSTTLNDRTIKVEFARSRKKPFVVPSAPMPKHIVFVGNLTWRVRSRHLRELFASTPGVQSVEVVFHTTSPRRSAGYGFVSFSSKEAAEAAISTFNGTKLMGRPINVMFKDDDAKKNKSAAPEEEDLNKSAAPEEEDLKSESSEQNDN
uniref:RRM domain-containing protein n=1 Tax=Leersia perrieri TaxID=77586 RepID=A0A0D9X917_9ORYZ